MMFVPADHYQCVRGWGGYSPYQPGASENIQPSLFLLFIPPIPKHPSSRIAEVDVVNEICPETTEKLR